MRHCVITVISLCLVGLCTSGATAQPSDITALLDKLEALEQLVVAQSVEMQAQRAAMQTQNAAMQAEIVTLQRVSQARDADLPIPPLADADGPVVASSLSAAEIPQRYQVVAAGVVGPDGATGTPVSISESGTNTSVGYQVLNSLTTGSYNMASGFEALAVIAFGKTTDARSTTANERGA